MLEDDALTEADIRVANAMIARMPRRVIAAINERAPAINAALARVPADATLAALEDEVPWAALEELIRAMDGIDEVRLPRATKVLHKKRPALIPILDEVVQKYLRAVDPSPPERRPRQRRDRADPQLQARAGHESLDAPCAPQ